ncbi:MAG TPA: hypothetical protein VNS60_01070 [Solirubrobacterales bacterium]|nr:hypothetical protein [Solirubrobacterales bacterium]
MKLVSRLRSSLLVLGVAACAASAFLSVGASTAAASNEAFCTFAVVPAGGVCLDGTFRKITRVNAKSINNSVCAGAYNSSGVQVGGWTCTAEAGETSNGNYNGSLFLKGAVLNNFSTTQTIGGGVEFYNP